MSKNTLYNYFTKSPGPAKFENSGQPRTPLANQNAKTHSKTPAKTPAKTPSKTKTPLKGKTPKSRASPDENLEKTPKTSRKRIINEEDLMDQSTDTEDILDNLEDSADEFVPENEPSDDSSDGEDAVVSEEPTTEEEESPVAQGKKRKRAVNDRRPSKRFAAKLPSRNSVKVDAASATSTSQSSQENSVGDVYNWSYLKYDFLKPDKIKDGKGRRPNDPNYDPRTLYVPSDFLKSLTPGMRQWWELKRNHYDCILFFKVGKFYEFYHMDAVTGVKELSLTFMKGEYAHCGFPEIAYGRFAANLVDKGYKVVRVEQTETPEMMAERVKKIHGATKFDKVVCREVCQMTTKGTRVFSINDGEAKEAQFSYLLAIAEKEIDSTKSSYGICFVDTSIGTFHIGQFNDDRHSSRLRTLLATYPPVQVLFERNRLSKRTHQILNTVVASTLKEALTPESEFWTSSNSLLKLAEKKYFQDGVTPEPLKSFIGEVDSLGLTASQESEMAVSCLGAITWFLTRALLDHQLLSMAHFEIYTPIDVASVSISSEKTLPRITARNMILDAVSLKNLNVIENNTGLQGTLLHRIDHCSTPFGKRLLRQWLCSPLANTKSIEARQQAVRLLKENSTLLSTVSDVLSKVPDLERMFSRIYAQSSKGLSESHPENRAVMFEEKIYSKRKIMEFISILKGFQALQKAAELVQDCDEMNESEIIVNVTHFPTGINNGGFPDLRKHLNFFNEAFDHEEAEKEGRIIPSRGVDAEYDSAIETLNEIKQELDSYLKEQCKKFGKVSYVGKDKNRFQLEIPDSAAKNISSEYELSGQRKGFKKYHTPTTKALLERQIAAEEVKISVLLDLRKRLFGKFVERYTCWHNAIECMATLDALMSLAKYCLSIEGDLCVPVFKEAGSFQKPYVKITNGKYPCITCQDNYIPNDTEVGGNVASIMLLTGPNMGGKSTLMRQAALLIILAQVGSFVPAEAMELTSVDRIFTRIGANDDIMSGDSTFYLEMCEASAILNYATAHSLVLVDELGRGTSTYDGTAIADAVLHELCRMGCRTIFSTHYHTLVDSFRNCDGIMLAHMSCMAESDDDTEEGKEEMVTFLYKLSTGACPKSFGFNAARLAGVPSHIIKVGIGKARLLEEEARNRKLFRALFTSEQPRQIIASL
ncbi:DNA mismatch repair protein Msh6 [Cimex lectularius]|uniref:DNA mismatch repair protein n=1 Tax=Cimex lectularius TaxID=79782 RepID=A0A8I6TIJ4_CIMLE|nr:DNA mismatch repair protein Msh6 [Cimex lectularius]